MRLTKRQLKRIIREEYSRLKRRGLIREMSDKAQPKNGSLGSGRKPTKIGHNVYDHRHPSSRQMSLQDYEEMDDNAEFDNYDACVEKCLAAIPPMMKQMCGMGMSHMVTNDIYHLCAPICEEMGCDCDMVSEEVEEMLCSGTAR